MNRKVSQFQALFRYFPDRPWRSEYGILRTTRLVGRPLGEQYDPIRVAIAGLIGPDYARKVDRENRARRSHALRREEYERANRGEGIPAPPQPSEADEAAAQAFLDRLAQRAGEPAGAGGPGPQGGRHAVPADSIELRLVDEESEIQGEVFPPLFLCGTCHRYYLLDLNGAQSLNCPEHGGDNELTQLNLVFACARCANIEPLLPHSVQLRNLSPGRVLCSRGHGLFLDIPSNLSNARWRCENQNCESEINDPLKGRLSRWCVYCNVSDEGLRNGESASIMAPRPATDGEIAVPLTATYVQDAEGNPLELGRLRRQHRDTGGSFTLSTVEPPAMRRLESLGVKEFFDVQHVQSILATYGYRSRVRPRPEVPERERYGHFFQPQPRAARFRAYVGITEGRGMILGFDQATLTRLRHDTGIATGGYSDRAADEIARVNASDFQDLLLAADSPRLYPMTITLHTLEHALRRSLISVIGLDDFESRILVSDGAVLIFETRDLDDGGIKQLNQHGGLMTDWVEGAIRLLNECPQLCRSACIACVKTDNTSCHGFLAHEFTRWMPPNVLLNRTLALDWIGINAGS